MKSKLRSLLWVAVALPAALLVGMALTTSSNQARAAEPDVSFAQDILPLLKWRCVSCHQPGGEGYAKSGLDLNSYQGLMQGTKFGPMVLPGNPETSNLMLLLDWRVPPAPTRRAWATATHRMRAGSAPPPACRRAAATGTGDGSPWPMRAKPRRAGSSTKASKARGFAPSTPTKGWGPWNPLNGFQGPPAFGGSRAEPHRH